MSEEVGCGGRLVAVAEIAPELLMLSGQGRVLGTETGTVRA